MANMPETVTISTPDGWGDYRLVRHGVITGPKPLEPCAYSQRNPAWASIPLGSSSYTVGSAGCAVTAATMLATMVNPELTPGSVTEWLTEHGGFTRDGLLFWSVVAQMVDGMEFVSYSKWRNTAADMDAITKALAHNPQVVQVDFHPGGALDTHFVLALGFTEDGKDLNIIDPWTGEHTRLLGAYGLATWDLKRAIYAMAEYRLDR